MTNQTGSTTEMIAGMLGVFALTECDNFSWRHVIIGLLLALYVLHGITRYKTTYESIVYCAVASLAVLIVIGKPLDWLRDTCFRDGISRDGALAITWVVLWMLFFFIGRGVSRSDKVTHETH